MFFVIAQQKGGVGKTTTAANLAVWLTRQDRRVLVVDTDPQFRSSAARRQIVVPGAAFSLQIGSVTVVEPEKL